MAIQDTLVKVSAKKEKEVLNYICDEIATALNDRTKLEERWDKWIRQYEEILPAKDFPWPNCSNISLPLSAIAVETIHSREVNTLFSIRPYIQIKPKKKGVSKDACAKIERFLQETFTNVVDLHEIGSQWILEKNKMGTGYIKPYWSTDAVKIGDTLIEDDDAKVDIIAIEDVIFPTNAKDIESSPWVSHRFRPHWNLLKAREARGIYKNVDKLRKRPEPSTKESGEGKDLAGTKEEIENMQRTAPEQLQEYTLHEVYLDYDIDGDGIPERTVMTIHRESRTILRWMHFPYKHGKRPIIRNIYQARVKRILGKGICEQSEHLQEGINTATNQTIDNMTIANVKCFKRRRGTERNKGDMTVYPGKTFDLDDITDLQEFSLGDVHQSNFVLHNMLRDYHERRTKVTDYTLGRESASMKSRATATGTLALLQESGRHFDLVINNTRKAFTELAYQIIELYAQYRPEKVYIVDGPEDTLDEIYLPNLEEDSVRESYNFSCTATSLSVNKEIEKQTNLMMLQQLGGIFSQMIQLLTVVMSPTVQMPPDLQTFVHGVIRSYYTMAKDLVRSFEKMDVESYVPDLPEIVKEAYGQGTAVTDFMNQIGSMMNGQEGSNTTIEGIGEIPGMGFMQGGNEGPI